MQPDSFDLKGFDAKSTCARSSYTGDTCSRSGAYTGGDCARSIWVRGACTWVTYIKYIFPSEASTRWTCIRDAYIENISAKGITIRGVNPIDYLKIYLQSCQILENGQYGTKLKTRVEDG